MRTGMGLDIHKFKAGRKLVLGGVEIEYSMGLEGHSDADVLVHSVMDAILGACGLGDIGVHFPDTNMKYKDISSLILLEKVREKMEKEKYSVVNIDSILVIQKPKISKYIPEMEKNIAKTLGINKDDINIKATTTEGLGFCGKGEGVVAYSVVLLK
ncbi:MAG: 2-C-methyl-D-erythritol 2,4-cyclodiphosphate synthase [Actinomycetota bacterium]|nr:2-C-methyl-D-erythritol 2,4-cyclodiphosphate synthase [Actinomycetota bacterium]